MLENLNLVTMLLVAVVGGALFGVTWYVSSRSGESPSRDKSPSRHKPKCRQKIDSETSGNNTRRPASSPGLADVSETEFSDGG